MKFTVDPLLAHEMIRESAGKIFYVEFRKKDGSRRRMTARIGVSKGVNGKGLRYDPLDYKLACVFDMDKRGFRMVDLNEIIRLRVGGRELTVTGETDWRNVPKGARQRELDRQGVW